MYHHLIAAAQTSGGTLVTPTNMRYLGFALLALLVYSILRSLGVFGSGD